MHVQEEVEDHQGEGVGEVEEASCLQEAAEEEVGPCPQSLVQVEGARDHQEDQG